MRIGARVDVTLTRNKTTTNEDTYSISVHSEQLPGTVSGSFEKAARTAYRAARDKAAANPGRAVALQPRTSLVSSVEALVDNLTQPKSLVEVDLSPTGRTTFSGSRLPLSQTDTARPADADVIQASAVLPAEAAHNGEALVKRAAKA